MRTNLRTLVPQPETHEGGRASRITPLQELERTVMACLLWENGFYESGVAVADRLTELVGKCKLEDVIAVAIKAREEQHLRHVPLLLMRLIAADKRQCKYADALAQVIQRADELAEFLSLYWKNGKCPIAKQVKLGLAKAFGKFNEYQLAKYNRDADIKLRDVLFLVRPKPKDDEQAAVFKRLANKELQTPDTWEVALSGGADKKETFERLIREQKLGYLALLRNLRNMEQSGVDRDLVISALQGDGFGRSKVLPFRFVAAARACPSFEPALDQAMQQVMEGMPRLPGKTVLLIDVSGSMVAPLSSKSDLTRLDAAAALGALTSGVCESVRVFSFSNRAVEVPARKGMALIDAVNSSQEHMGTALARSWSVIRETVKAADRTIIITDEQACDITKSPEPLGVGYLINVATDKHGIGYDRWTHINGFSESVLTYIAASEQ